MALANEDKAMVKETILAENNRYFTKCSMQFWRIWEGLNEKVWKNLPFAGLNIKPCTVHYN